MPLTRREFMRAGMMSAISAGFILNSARIGFAQTTTTAARDIPLEARKDPVFSFQPDTFKPYVGGYFEAPNARGEMIALQLVSLETFKPSRTALRLTKKMGDTESFSLLFKADAELPPFTSIHKIKHPSLGEFSLFLSPKKGENGELFYEAVINHIQ
jgi:hypothetical protein